MKFKTQLMITFASIIILPLTLIFVAYILISVRIMNVEQGYDLLDIDYTKLTDSVQVFEKISGSICDKLETQIKQDPSMLNDVTFYEQMAEKLPGKYSYLIVRKNNALYYTDNKEDADTIFKQLPKYGLDADDDGTGYYYNDTQKLVKQIDYEFSNGDEGSIFIVTRVTSIMSKKMLLDMTISMVVILIFTSCMLTRWIHKGVFQPISELKVAMQNIAEGNLEYQLKVGDGKGSELEELYRNYEDMRLRLKESTEEKFEHEKQNRELISNISHDLKTPITAIKGYMEGIMDGVADTPEKMDKYIKTVYNKTNDMDRLINELTIYSKIDNNRIPYNFHRINVAEYFGDCVEEVGLDLESKSIKLNYSNLVAPDTKIIADPEQMKRVINNIIGNSVKYLDKENGVIDIRILDEIDSIRVEIEDNGKGIAAKDLQNIFDRFFRTDASRNSSKGGSGIGLSIVKKIIEDHGGYIWATSKENEGTCMHFVIRKYKEAEG